MKFYGEIKEGKLVIFNRHLLNEWISKQKDMKIEGEIGKYDNDRTNEQNRLYQAYARILSNELGFEFEDMKETLKKLFLVREKVNENGVIITYIEKTSKLKVPEFVIFTQEIQRWAAQEWGIVLEDPNFQTKIKLG